MGVTIGAGSGLGDDDGESGIEGAGGGGTTRVLTRWEQVRVKVKHACRSLFAHVFLHPFEMKSWV